MKTLRSALWLGAAFFSVCTMAHAAPLTITTEEYPPLNFSKDGKITGSSTELLQKALDENKIEAKIAVYPWARAYDMAQKEDNTCVYSTTRTPEREALFKWAGPLATEEWILVGRADSPKLNDYKEAKTAIIGGYKNDAFAEFLKQNGLQVEEAAEDSVNPKKLKAKRIDYWATHRFEGQDIAKLPGGEGLVSSAKVKTVSLYLACNKNVPDDVMEKLNASFKKMNDNGDVLESVKKYQ